MRPFDLHLTTPTAAIESFKIGDRVICTNRTDGGGFTYGKIYTIKEVVPSKPTVHLRFEKDDIGNTNGWNSSNFRKVTLEEERDNLTHQSPVIMKKKVHKTKLITI